MDEAASAKVWRRGGNTKQNEDGSVPGSIDIAWVSTPVPASASLSVGYNDFDIILDHFPRVFQLHPTPHVP